MFRFQWNVDKLALGVHLGPRFISSALLNNTKWLSSHIEVFKEKTIRKKKQTKIFIEIL